MSSPRLLRRRLSVLSGGVRIGRSTVLLDHLPGLNPHNPDPPRADFASREPRRDLSDAIAAPHPDAGFQRVNGRLLAAGPDDFLHAFEDESGEPSAVAERIVELADGTRTIAEIADALCAEFEVEPERCRTDTARFIELLIDRHLLVLRRRES